MKSFEEKLNSPFYKYSKLAFDLLALNIIFILMSALSLFILFFPGLISLHKVMNNFVNNIDEKTYQTFFQEIKRQWSFSWRVSILCWIIIIVLGVIAYVDISIIVNTNQSYLGYGSLIIVVPTFLVLTSIFVNLMLYNNYYDDDTFKVMLKKSSLITLKKKLLTFLNLIIFICFVVLLFFFPFLIPFISFSLYIYIVEAINKKAFIKIANQEKERALKPENLFLPVKVEEKK